MTGVNTGVPRPFHSIPEAYMTARKVLIVEDNVALLRGLKDNFQAQGYQVRTANDGAKGLDALFRDPPDLLLLDLMLPKVNGYEICRQARSRQLSTPILMLSAKCQEDDVVRGLELGADDYLTKPFGIRELMARAKRLSKSRAGVPPAPVPGAAEDRRQVAAGILPAVEGGILPPGEARDAWEIAIPPGRMPGSTAGKMPAATAQVGSNTELRAPVRRGLRAGVEPGLPSLPGDSRQPEP
jgi:CheY-like chemotaxis protein